MTRMNNSKLATGHLVTNVREYSCSLPDIADKDVADHGRTELGLTVPCGCVQPPILEKYIKEVLLPYIQSCTYIHIDLK
jgi:hypothetical protein